MSDVHLHLPICKSKVYRFFNGESHLEWTLFAQPEHDEKYIGKSADVQIFKTTFWKIVPKEKGCACKKVNVCSIKIYDLNFKLWSDQFIKKYSKHNLKVFWFNGFLLLWDN